MTKELIRIATRGSMLALQQSGMIKAALEKLWPEIRFELQIIKTTGDKITDVPLAKVGGKGLFVKEIEDALLDGSADLAVHSMKDVPADLPEGLEIAAVPEREDPRDALIIREGKTIGDLASRRAHRHQQPSPRRPDTRHAPRFRSSRSSRKSGNAPSKAR